MDETPHHRDGCAPATPFNEIPSPIYQISYFALEFTQLAALKDAIQYGASVETFHTP
ncbi:hypothetical protein FHR32_008418 [Streptosporangium album]|uniref:Uncharacterized protein n=1 Tax=Streptosporangium album TaxID=47479 RepID=A0A7W7S5S6_9ACTN|nr:hypothetical protein [Streptosporangium album]MBB4944017.1 hypothetical protein [Streptosporangium album]